MKGKTLDSTKKSASLLDKVQFKGFLLDQVVVCSGLVVNILTFLVSHGVKFKSY